MSQRIPYRTPRSQLVAEDYVVECPTITVIRILSFHRDGVGYLMQFTDEGVPYLTTYTEGA